MGVECQAPTFYPLISALLSNNPCAFCATKCDRVYTLLDVIIQSRSLEWVILAKSATEMGKNGFLASISKSRILKFHQNINIKIQIVEIGKNSQNQYQKS